MTEVYHRLCRACRTGNLATVKICCLYDINLELNDYECIRLVFRLHKNGEEIAEILLQKCVVKCHKTRKWLRLRAVDKDWHQALTYIPVSDKTSETEKLISVAIQRENSATLRYLCENYPLASAAVKNNSNLLVKVLMCYPSALNMQILMKTGAKFSPDTSVESHIPDVNYVISCYYRLESAPPLCQLAAKCYVGHFNMMPDAESVPTNITEILQAVRGIEPKYQISAST